MESEGQVAGGEGEEGEQETINIEKKARKIRKEKRWRKKENRIPTLC